MTHRSIDLPLVEDAKSKGTDRALPVTNSFETPGAAVAGSRCHSGRSNANNFAAWHGTKRKTVCFRRDMLPGQPSTGGSHASHHRKAEIDSRARRRGDVPARGARAAARAHAAHRRAHESDCGRSR